MKSSMIVPATTVARMQSSGRKEQQKAGKRRVSVPDNVHEPQDALAGHLAEIGRAVLERCKKKVKRIPLQVVEHGLPDD